MPKVNKDSQSGVQLFSLVDNATVLARYDRQVADVFLAEAAASRPRALRGDVRYDLAGIRARMVVDPPAPRRCSRCCPPSLRIRVLWRIVCSLKLVPT